MNTNSEFTLLSATASLVEVNLADIRWGALVAAQQEIQRTQWRAPLPPVDPGAEKSNVDRWLFVADGWWCMVDGGWVAVDGWCLMLAAWFLMVDGWCLMLDAWWLTLHIWDLMLDGWWIMDHGSWLHTSWFMVRDWEPSAPQGSWVRERCPWTVKHEPGARRNEPRAMSHEPEAGYEPWTMISQNSTPWRSGVFCPDRSCFAFGTRLCFFVFHKCPFPLPDS